MAHRFSGRDTSLVVVAEEPVEEVDGLVRDQVLVVGRDETGPRLARPATDQVVKVLREQDVILGINSCQSVWSASRARVRTTDLVEELVKVGRPKNLDYLDELVVIVCAVKDGILAQDHGRERAPSRPHFQVSRSVLQSARRRGRKRTIERVVVERVVDEELWAFVVATGDADVELFVRVVELCEAPVDEAQLAFGVVDEDVERLDVAVDDALRMAKVERLEEFVHVVAAVVVGERRVELLRLGVVDVFEHDRRDLALLSSVVTRCEQCRTGTSIARGRD